MVNNTRTVILKRPSQGGFGFSVYGGIENDLTLSISEIDPNSVAEKTEELSINDEIIKINGTSVVGSSHDEVMRMIQETTVDLELVIICSDSNKKNSHGSRRVSEILAAPSAKGSEEEEMKDVVRSKLYTVSLPYTTRKLKESEVHGDKYFFVANAEFQRMIKEGYFIEYGKNGDNWYGSVNPTAATKLANAGKVPDDLKLPNGWERRTTEDGRTYFLEHKTETTSWLHPLAKVSSPQTWDQCHGEDMPWGWEVIHDNEKGKYYANHMTKETSLVHPKPKSTIGAPETHSDMKAKKELPAELQFPTEYLI